MNEITKAVVIGVVQAVTEFLPVSSSGHLVIAKALLRFQEVGITIEVVTHLATSVAVIVFLRRRIADILRALYAQAFRRGQTRTAKEREDFRTLLFVVAASVPAGIVGLIAHASLERLFNDTSTTAVMLVVTGVFVLISGRAARGGHPLTLGRALFVGIAQAFAIVPGLSRSGLTVGAGLIAGLERKTAFEFSLLLSLPAIIGASAVEAATGRIGGAPLLIVASAVPAMVGGYLAISLLFKTVVRNTFHRFGYYLIPVGMSLLIWRLGS